MFHDSYKFATKKPRFSAIIPNHKKNCNNKLHPFHATYKNLPKSDQYHLHFPLHYNLLTSTLCRNLPVQRSILPYTEIFKIPTAREKVHLT